MNVNAFYICRFAHKLFFESFEPYIKEFFQSPQEVVVVTSALLLLVPYSAIVSENRRRNL